MSDDSTVIRGACHCGAVKVEMQLSGPADEVLLRRCGCSFCRRVGALAYSDPQGHAHIDGRLADISLYQFGEEAADFVICHTCGVFVAAISDDGERPRCVVNVPGIAPDVAAGLDSVPLQAAGEDRAGRKQRHAARWMPVTFSDPAIPSNLRTVALPAQA